jgi:hypothetical protein
MFRYNRFKVKGVGILYWGFLRNYASTVDLSIRICFCYSLIRIIEAFLKLGVYLKGKGDPLEPLAYRRDSFVSASTKLIKLLCRSTLLYAGSTVNK